MKYRSHIDGLRGCAVLAVVLYHAGVAWIPGGFMGVDMFFVISGFLITGLLVREHETTGGISLAAFYERRVRRLGPALFVVLVATLAMGVWLLSPVLGEQQGLAKSAIATVLLVSNHYFAGSVGDYFDDPAEVQPLLHTWSLSVEEQFYLVWPLMLLVVLGVARARRVSPSWWLGAVLFGLWVASFMASLWATEHLPQWAFFATPFRAWEFAVGGLIFLLARQPAPSNPALLPLLAWGGLTSLALGLLFVDESVPFPGYAALLPTLGTASWMLLGEWYGRSVWARLLSTKWLVGVGLVSYSLYLWHWPLLSILRIHQLGEPPAWMIGATCLAALVLAMATYRWVEQPVRRKQVSLMSTRRRAYLVGSLGSLCVLSLGIALGLGGKSAVASSSSMQALQDSLIEMRKVRVPCAQSSPYRGRFDGHPDCGTDEVSLQKPAGVLLWGDSHAAHLAPAVRSIVDDMQLSLRIRYMPECPPALAFSPSLIGIDRRVGCERFNADGVLPRLHGRLS